MPRGHYHIGIRRDENDKNIWKRSDNGMQVYLEGWYPDRPYSRDGYDILFWYFENDSKKNTIYNLLDIDWYFICEY